MTSSKRTYASKLHLPVLQSVSLTPQQATVDPCLCWRLPNTHRQVWLLWGHFSFLLGPGMHKVLCVPFKSVSPVLQKFCNQFPLDLKVKFPGGSQSLWIPRLGNLVWALAFSQQCQNFFGIIVLRFVAHLFRGSIVGLMVTSSKSETGIPVLVRRTEEQNP